MLPLWPALCFSTCWGVLSGWHHAPYVPSPPTPPTPKIVKGVVWTRNVPKLGWKTFEEKEKRSLFVILFFFLVFLVFRDVVRLSRLRPRPRNLLIDFCVDSVTCLEMISSALTSGDFFSAISVKILPPLHNDSRPRALVPLQKMGLTNGNELPKNFPFRIRVEEKVGWNIWDRCQYHFGRSCFLLV